MFCQQSGLPQTSGDCSQFAEFYGVFATCPQGIKVHRTFSLWTRVFHGWCLLVQRVFCQIFLLFRLESAHDLFSAAVKCTLLGRIRIFYSSLYCFFIFCVVKSLNGLKTTQKVECSLLSSFCFLHVLCIILVDTWHQRCRVAPLYAKPFFAENPWFSGADGAQSSVCRRKEPRQAQARADLKFPVCFPEPSQPSAGGWHWVL